MLRLRTFGGVTVEGPEGPLGGAAAQRRMLAILSVLAVAGDRGVSRDRLLALLWPEGEPERARHALTQSLYHLKRALGRDDAIVSSGDLRLNPEVITSDVGEFDEALDAGEPERAVALYAGPFLDGFYVSGSAEFEQWASSQRDRLADRCAHALEVLAAGAEAAGEFPLAVRWRKQLTVIDPFNSRHAVQLMSAMVAAGDRAGAIQHARVHETLLREQLEVAPDAAVTALADRLKEESAWSGVEVGVGVATVTPPGDLAAVRDAPVGAERDRWDGGEERELASPTGGGPPAAQVDARATAPPRRPLSGRRLAVLVIALAALAAIVTAVTRRDTRPGAPPPINADLIAVAPFRVTGADASLAYLREGMMDLLVAKLTDEGSARAADPGSVMRIWRRAGLSEAAEVPLADALAASRQLGAGQLLVGGIVGTPARVVVSASLMTVPDGGVRARATVEGPADSLTVLVDRLAGQLIASQAGEGEHLASYTTASLPALRWYLRGQSAFRAGRYEEAVQHFSRAVQRDTSFAMAGFGLALAADHIDATEERERGLAIAWRSRDALAERDRAYFDAFAGPRYPAITPDAERLAAWERAAAAVPDRGDVWSELGERLLQDGRLLGIRRPEERAVAAFRRARELDPTLPQPLQYLVQLAAQSGDAKDVRAAWSEYASIDSASDIADFLRWRVAVALRDSVALDSSRARLVTASTVSLRSIAQATMFDALETREAVTALAAIRARAARHDERLDALLGQHALALNNGRIAEAAEIVDDIEGAAPASRLHLRLRVADALYSEGAPGAAAEAARALLAAPARPTPPAVATPALPAPEDACIAEQWRIARGELGGARQTITGLRGRSQGDEVPDEATVCAVLLDAMLAVSERQPDAIRFVERADSALRAGPVGDEMRAYATLALTRLYRALGEREAALEAVRRRPYMRGWPAYLSSYLREEGRLATQEGERAAAARAYEQYLALRSAPDAELASQVDSVKGELARVNRRRGR